MRLLVIEDYTQLREALARGLRDGGYHRRGAPAGLVGVYRRCEQDEGDEEGAVHAAMVAVRDEATMNAAPRAWRTPAPKHSTMAAIGP